MKFEYKIIECESLFGFTEFLNFFGARGWEVVHIEYMDPKVGRRCIFKRKIE